MELPEEDSTAQRKRSAIQSIMKDTSLTSAQRHLKIQEVMRGNFDNVDGDDESEEEGSSSGEEGSESGEESASESEGGSSSEGSYETGSSSEEEEDDDDDEEEGTNDGSQKSNHDDENSNATESASEVEEESSIDGEENSAQSTQSNNSSAQSTQSNSHQSNSGSNNNNNLRESGNSYETSSSYETESSAGQDEGNETDHGEENETDHDDDDGSKSSRSSRSSNSNSSSATEESSDHNMSSSDNMMMSRSGEGTKNIGTPSALLQKQSPSPSASSTTNNTNEQQQQQLQDIITKVQNNDPTLTSINLPNQNLSDTDLLPLFTSLSTNTHVTTLSLPNNQITNTGSTTLFRILNSDNVTIQQITLSNNAIGDKGANALANALLDNESLISVNLSNNNIGNRGARDILKVLDVNETLENLVLEGNSEIDDGVLEEIQRVIEESDSESESGESESEGESSYESGSESGEESGSESDSESGEEEEEEEESNRGVTLGDDAQEVGGSAGGGGGEGVQLTGGEAMLEDMPDEDNAALAKRQLIQQIMKDKSLSPIERNKKMQDVMAGRVELPKVEKKPAQLAPSPPKSDDSKSGDSESGDSESDSDAQSQDGESLENEPDEKPSPPTKMESTDKVESEPAPSGGDKDDNNNERKKALQEVMMDTSLSAPERQQRIQEIMEGKPDEATNAASKNGEDVKKPDAPPTNVIEVQRAEESHTETEKVHKRRHRRKKASNHHAGVVPTNMIAQEWKRKMMEPHPRSHDDLLDILLAHKYRLSLKAPPRQSCFRVVAVVFFSVVVNGELRSERYHVVGTNDEPHSIAGSICAERAALMQLRFIPNLESITKIVIVTDDADSVSPGMLCREFMASHDKIPWDVPIILGRSVCKKCGFSITGNTCGDPTACFVENDDFQETQNNIFAMCSAGHEESKHKQYTTPHNFLGTTTTLRELFPYPSLYTRLSCREALQMGEKYFETTQSGNNGSKRKKDVDSRNVLADRNNDVSDEASTGTSSTGAGSFRQDKFDLSMLADILEEEEAENVDSPTERKQPDVRKSSFVSPAQMKSSMTHSLKTTIDFMRQLQEDSSNTTSQHDTAGVGVVPDSLDRLTASKIRISSRLKPSQRREKLLKFATEATVFESQHQRNVHPIRYGAAVLFSDNSVSIASQKVAIEYGCTLDAVGQLATIIDKKALQLDEETPGIRPILLVQCDQFGIAHPPFAQGRAFLTERGYGDCKVLLHQQRQSRPYPTIMEEKSLRDFGEEEDNVGGEKKELDNVDLRLIEVDANSLAPSPPDIFGVVKSTQTHSSQRLQIQF